VRVNEIKDLLTHSLILMRDSITRDVICLTDDIVGRPSACGFRAIRNDSSLDLVGRAKSAGVTTFVSMSVVMVVVVVMVTMSRRGARIVRSHAINNLLSGALLGVRLGMGTKCICLADNVVVQAFGGRLC